MARSGRASAGPAGTPVPAGDVYVDVVFAPGGGPEARTMAVDSCLLQCTTRDLLGAPEPVIPASLSGEGILFSSVRVHALNHLVRSLMHT